MIILTQSQWNTLTAIQQHIKAHGLPPTLDEMANALGLQAKSTARRRIQKLVRSGVVRPRPPRTRRTIGLKPVTVMIRYEDGDDALPALPSL